MVFSMANGFERMLKQMKRKNAETTSGAELPPSDRPNAVLARADRARETRDRVRVPEMSMQHDPGMMPTYAGSHQSFSPNDTTNGGVGQVPMYGNGNSIGAYGDLQYGSWGFQDEELWSLGLGYDLLAPNGQGLADTDFTARSYNGNDIGM
jgi:hypothetical protein